MLIGLLVALLLLHRFRPSDKPEAPRTLLEGAYQVQRVVDGDTLVLENLARVRLIGANTPETVRPNHPVEDWGPEATAFTKRFVAAGPVRLQFDGPRKDRYGRFLAHVWRGDRLLSEELVRRGLARPELQYPFSAAIKSRLRQARDEAEATGRGIWSR